LRKRGYEVGPLGSIASTGTLKSVYEDSMGGKGGLSTSGPKGVQLKVEKEKGFGGALTLRKQEFLVKNQVGREKGRGEEEMGLRVSTPLIAGERAFF